MAGSKNPLPLGMGSVNDAENMFAGTTGDARNKVLEMFPTIGDFSGDAKAEQRAAQAESVLGVDADASFEKESSVEAENY